MKSKCCECCKCTRKKNVERHDKWWLPSRCCSKCKVKKSPSDFHKDKSLPGGLKRQCKKCVAVYSKRYREKRGVVNKEPSFAMKVEKLLNDYSEESLATKIEKLLNDYSHLSE